MVNCFGPDIAVQKTDGIPMVFLLNTLALTDQLFPTVKPKGKESLFCKCQDHFFCQKIDYFIENNLIFYFIRSNNPTKSN